MQIWQQGLKLLVLVFPCLESKEPIFFNKLSWEAMWTVMKKLTMCECSLLHSTVLILRRYVGRTFLFTWNTNSGPKVALSIQMDASLNKRQFAVSGSIFLRTYTSPQRLNCCLMRPERSSLIAPSRSLNARQVRVQWKFDPLQQICSAILPLWVCSWQSLWILLTVSIMYSRHPHQCFASLFGSLSCCWWYKLLTLCTLGAG